MKKYLVVVLFFLACNNDDQPQKNGKQSATQAMPSAINYNVVNVFNHDTSSFTEGLLWHDDALFESTGLEGHSHVMKIELATGRVLQKKSMPAHLFGEGISIIGDSLYQLTWQDHVVYVYDVKTFKKIAEYNWPYQGWGMTTNGKELFISTGSNNIYVVDPSGFKIKSIISVSDHNGPLANINELELVGNDIYANIWQTNYIVRIDKETGKVTARMDLTDIWKKSNISEPLKKDVLNGIAYNPSTKTFYVTGKYWPHLFEIRLN